MQESMPSMPADAPVLGGVSERPPDGPTPEGSPADPFADPRAMQILATEHWSLLATRSLAYNESFTRSGMFLTFLSATLIVIGFLVGAQGLSPDVLPIVLMLLLADLFVGVVTVGRLIDASAEELQTVRGMNRIRHAYRDMVPSLEPYFVSGFHDDAQGVLSTYGYAHHGGVLGNLFHGLTTIIGMIATIVSLVFAAICGLVAAGVGATIDLAMAVAIVGFVMAFATFIALGNRLAFRGQDRIESRFPTPGGPQA